MSLLHEREGPIPIYSTADSDFTKKVSVKSIASPLSMIDDYNTGWLDGQAIIPFPNEQKTAFVYYTSIHKKELKDKFDIITLSVIFDDEDPVIIFKKASILSKYLKEIKNQLNIHYSDEITVPQELIKALNDWTGKIELNDDVKINKQEIKLEGVNLIKSDNFFNSLSSSIKNRNLTLSYDQGSRQAIVQKNTENEIVTLLKSRSKKSSIKQQINDNTNLDFETLVSMGLIYQKLNSYQEAELFYKKALLLNPNNTRIEVVKTILASILIINQKFLESKSILNEIVKDYPHNSIAIDLLNILAKRLRKKKSSNIRTEALSQRKLLKSEIPQQKKLYA
ncbi:MAG: tetratricopeptide repeat protein [Candidatus Hodarchaeales archaeon]